MNALREREGVGADLATRLRAVEKALEPVCDLLQLKARPPDAPDAADPSALAKLPDPLRLIYSKFDVLAAFGPESGVTVHIDTEQRENEPEVLDEQKGEDADKAKTEEPPAKRARTDASAGSSQEAAEVSVRVDVTSTAGAISLRFWSPKAPLVTVGADGEGSEGLLETLWTEDDGRGPLAKTIGENVRGKPFGWAQILAGVREQAAALAPATFALPNLDGSVTASDVVRRIREKLNPATA